mmetsp:Transcript_24618/g.56820  ORF Transcript_24618/g.56820 Transcript_24618/m.56820 type:complete len:506 (-) Transcript_24618:124-1641(-)
MVEAPTDMIEPLHGTDKFRVRMRQQLRTPEKADEFVVQLTAFCERNKELGKVSVFEDFDISQNLLQSNHMEGIVAALQDSNTHVERFRAFALPYLDDMACHDLANWLSTVTVEHAPCEMHLSDCAITAVGFDYLMQAIMENDAFPPLDPKRQGAKLPMYLRLEHNYIDPTTIQEKIDEGVLAVMRKTGPAAYAPEVKCRLLVHEDGKLKQKDGDPPSPEDAPAPKRVQPTRYDEGTTGGWARNGHRDSKDSSSHSWSKRITPLKSSEGSRSYGSSYGSASDWRKKASAGRQDDKWESKQALPAPASTTRERVQWPTSSSSHAERHSGSSYRSDNWSDSRYSSYNKRDDASRHTSSGTDRRAQAKTYDDYSRTKPRHSSYPEEPPAKRARFSKDSGRDHQSDRKGWQDDRRWDDSKGRESAKGSGRVSAIGSRRQAPDTANARVTAGSSRRPREPAAPERSRARPTAAPDGKDLPDGWEIHVAEEYDIEYFWNRLTGESSWERPTG